MTPRPLCAGAGEFIDGQYPDRPDLRPILDATLALAPTLGEVAVQTLGPRRWPRVWRIMFGRSQTLLGCSIRR